MFKNLKENWEGKTLLFIMFVSIIQSLSSGVGSISGLEANNSIFFCLIGLILLEIRDELIKQNLKHKKSCKESTNG